MIKTILALGIAGVTGAASICELCGPRSATPLVAAAAVADIAGSATARVTPSVEPATVTLKVEGMTCGGCVIGVRTVLRRLDGVREADVSYEQQRAVVNYDTAKVTVEQMIAAIKTLGYKASLVTA